MRIVKTSKQALCYKCANDVLRNETCYKSGLGYMHLFCGKKGQQIIKEINSEKKDEPSAI